MIDRAKSAVEAWLNGLSRRFAWSSRNCGALDVWDNVAPR